MINNMQDSTLNWVSWKTDAISKAPVSLEVKKQIDDLGKHRGFIYRIFQAIGEWFRSLFAPDMSKMDMQSFVLNPIGKNIKRVTEHFKEVFGLNGDPKGFLKGKRENVVAKHTKFLDQSSLGSLLPLLVGLDNSAVYLHNVKENPQNVPSVLSAEALKNNLGQIKEGSGDKRFVFMPHYHDKHIVTIIVDKEAETIFYFDPKGKEKGNAITEDLITQISEQFELKNPKVLGNPFAHQKDHFNCGVFAAMFIAHMAEQCTNQPKDIEAAFKDFCMGLNKEKEFTDYQRIVDNERMHLAMALDHLESNMPEADSRQEGSHCVEQKGSSAMEDWEEVEAF